MLTLNPSSLRATLGDAAPSTIGSGASSVDPAGFASLLRQTQMTPPPMPEPPAPAPVPTAAAPKPPADKAATTEPVSSKESPDEAPASPESDTAQRTRALLKGRLRAADGSVAPRDAKPALDARDGQVAIAKEAGDKADAADESADKRTVAADCNAPETQLTGASAPVDPNVMQWLTGLQRAAAGQAADARPAADGPAGAEATDTGVIETRRAAHGALAAGAKTDTTLIKAPPAEAVVGSSPFAAVLAEQPDIVEKPRSQAIDGVKDVAAAGAGAVSPAPTGGSDAAAPVAVPIAAPVNAPDFAQELGLRLSTLAKDGVQTAELHLNPAEMGPVSVQIVMDGAQARVDFGADMAATRQAIEAGLPQLASALADAGFTLAGGGVSQHAGGRQGGQGSGASEGDAPRRIAAESTVKQVASAARRIVTKGGIDLFA